MRTSLVWVSPEEQLEIERNISSMLLIFSMVFENEARCTGNKIMLTIEKADQNQCMVNLSSKNNPAGKGEYLAIPQGVSLQTLAHYIGERLYQLIMLLPTGNNTKIWSRVCSNQKHKIKIQFETVNKKSISFP